MGDRFYPISIGGCQEDINSKYYRKESNLLPSLVSVTNERIFSFDCDEDRFVEAASNGDLKQLLNFSSTMSVNSRNYREETPLIAASIGGHHNAVFFLLSKGATASMCDSTGNTALHHAAQHKHLNVIDKLVLKADINTVNKRGQTILHLVVEEENLSVLDHIMKFPKLNMDAQDANGDTAAHIAVKKNSLKALRQLITMPIDLAIYNSDGLNPLNLSTMKKENGLEFLRTLLQTKHGMDVLLCRTSYGESNLEIAIRERKSEVLSFLLTPSMHPEEMLNSDIDRKYGATALHWAVFTLDIDLIGKLIKMNSNLLNVKDKFGKTPLDHLCCMHELENSTKERLVNIAIKLISTGADMGLVENNKGLHKLIKDIFLFKFKM